MALAAVGVASFMWYQTTNAPSIANNTTVPEIGPGLPTNLTIPTIGVNAPVIQLGLAKDGSVDVPKGPSEVSWFKLGPRPGQEGIAILTGHFGPWQTGAKSVFDNLNTLKKGDLVHVEDDRGKTLTFVVRETRTYEATETATEVFKSDNGIHLNLITCSGDWLHAQKTYTQRLVVFTDLVP